MSWDVMIFNFGGKRPPTLEQLQESDCVPLGPARDVRELISMVLPGVDWSAPTWGLYARDGFSIEFNVGADDPIANMMLHVRGSGDAITVIMAFTRPQGWSALDCSTSEFLDPNAPSDAGWCGFQAYRDRIVGAYRDRGQLRDLTDR